MSGPLHGTRTMPSAARYGVALIVVALPIVVAAVLSATLLNGSLRQALPLINDEVAYWNQVATFAATGLNGGYIVVDEHPSRVTWSHFGPHGPVYATLLGLVAKGVGWGRVSGPVFGAAAFAAAAVLWMLWAQPPPLMTALFLASFWPLVVTLPSTMQEAVHMAIGAAFAPLLLRLLKDARISRRLMVACVMLLVVASLVRPVWALLALPLGWYACARQGRVRGIAGLLAGTALMGALYVAFMTLAAPFPREGSPQLSDLVRDPRDLVHRVVRRATVESPEDWLSSNADPLERLNRYELMAIALLTCGLSFRRAADGGTRRVDRFVASTIALLIGSTLAIGNIGGWTDFRATTPVLLTVLLLCASTRPGLVWAIAAVHIAATPVAITTFKNLHEQRFSEARNDAVDEFAARVSRHIRFDPTVNPWGNTILVNAERYQAPLLGLPRGIGASAVAYWTDVTFPLRSRYVILLPSELEMLGDRVRLRKLDDTPLGQLFENQDWRP